MPLRFTTSHVFPIMTKTLDLAPVDVTAHDLPLQCPPAGTRSWNLHPRVSLDVVKTGEAVCPYCGTRYVFKGEAPKGH